MVESSREPDTAARAFWLWLGFWVQFLVLAVCVVLGAFAASNAAQPGDYAAGLVLIVSALTLAFLRLRQSFDQQYGGPRNFLFVENMASLALVVPIFVVVGLAGLFVARAWPNGSLHDGGITLFIASGVIVFLDIKQVFDRTTSL
ncbi:MAG: hypothetical protein JO081_13070 [Alphaproteobacteria bacterium]|nr:hypothetical protein [Alphaproteobacteria bacterium]